MIKYLTYISLFVFVFFAFFGIVSAKPLLDGENSLYIREVFDEDETEEEALLLNGISEIED